MKSATEQDGERGAADVLVVLCTCPDARVAARLASALVRQGVAACVNILPEIRSIYAWQGEVQDEAETLMLIKTTRESYRAVETWLEQHHPYDVPEVLALPVHGGLGAYLNWVVESTGQSK